MQRIFSMELAGRTITAETGKYAEQAGGSVLDALRRHGRCWYAQR